MGYDVGIIGGGPGGYVAAIKAAQQGLRCILFEEDALGGVCLNRGCIPTKTLLKSAQVLHAVKNAAAFGINVDGFSVDYRQAAVRKKGVVRQLTSGVGSLLKKNGVSVISRYAELQTPGLIRADGETYEVKNVILATGSVPAKPPIPGIEYAMDSDDLLELEELPESIAIVGGGVIGLEFAVLLAEFGVRVTIVEALPGVISMADADVAALAADMLRKMGIAVYANARVTEITEGGIAFESAAEGKQKLAVQRVLVATGRTPNTDIAMLDRLGIRHERGRIGTDERMRTSRKGIYAIGDANGKWMLAHTASAEGAVAVADILDRPAAMRYDRIPQCIYTTPEIAWIGLTEQQARNLGIACKTGVFPMTANGKSLAEGDTSGMIKLVADEAGEIVGGHLMCAHATDMIAELAVLINMEGLAEDIAGTIHPHPTVSEALMEAAEALTGRAVHI